MSRPADASHHVRRVTPADVEITRTIRLAALLDSPSAFGKTHAEEVAYSDDHWATSTAERSTGPDNATFLAFPAQGTTPIGIVGGYRPTSDGPYELVSMWVAPPHRGSSAASDLVNAVIAWAADSGGNIIELWVTRGNDRAQAFYERCGFILTGDHAPLPSDPCKDEVRMRRSL